MAIQAVDERFVHAMKAILDSALRDLGPERTSWLAQQWLDKDGEVAPGYQDLLRVYVIQDGTDG